MTLEWGKFHPRIWYSKISFEYVFRELGLSFLVQVFQKLLVGVVFGQAFQHPLGGTAGTVIGD